MKKYLLLLVLVAASSLGLRAEDAYPLMFRPLSVDVYSDMPADLAKAYPNDQLIMVVFKPVSHPANKDGSNLKAGEGSWLDRGMRPSEPDRIRILVAAEDMLPHTLKVSEGPFILKVRNSGKGYFETVPLASPELQLASGPTDAPVTPPPTSAEPSLSGEVVVAMRYLQLEGVSHPRLYLYRANGQFLRQLTREPGPVDDINPFFSPDGSVIIFTRVTAAERTCWSIEPLGSDLHQLKEPPAWYQTVEGRSGLVDSDSPTLSPSPSAPPETSDIISDKTDDNYSETHYRLPDRRGQFIRKEDLKKDTVTYSVVDSNGNTHVLDYSEDSSFVGAFDPDGNVHFLTKGNRTFVILYLHDSTINSFSIADLSDYSVTPLVSNIKSVDPKNLDEQVSGLSDVFSIPEGFLVTAFHKYESYGTENNYHTDHASYIEFFDNQFKHNISYSQPGAGMPYGFSWYRKDVTPHVRWLPVAIPEKGLVVPDPKDLSQQ